MHLDLNDSKGRINFVWIGQPLVICRKYCFVLVGFYFLIAAMLKAFDEGVPSGPFSPALKLSSIYVETLIGFFMIVGLFRLFSWFTSTALILIFIPVSFNLALTGYSECGCFGPIKVNPWITTVLDFFVLFLLFWSLPHYVFVQPFSSLGITGFLVMIMSGFAFLLNGQFGDHLIANFRGDLVYISPTITDLGSHKSGSLKSFRINVINRSNYPVRMIGGSASCNHSVFKDLPLTLPSKSQKEIEIDINHNGERGYFSYSYQLFTDQKKRHKIFGAVSGEISFTTPF